MISVDKPASEHKVDDADHGDVDDLLGGHTEPGSRPIAVVPLVNPQRDHDDRVDEKADNHPPVGPLDQFLPVH